MPFGFHLTVDTLPSGEQQEDGSRSALAVSGFRLRARLGFSIPVFSPGRRGVTPAFGYGAPHPGPRGTSTLLNNALLSAHYGPIRHPMSPGLSVAGVRLIVPDHVTGFPVLRALSLCTCCRHYPGTAAGCAALLIRPAVSAFPANIVGSACASSFFEACSAFTRVTARTLALPPSRGSLYPEASASSSPP
jgi:hypothetical protein